MAELGKNQSTGIEWTNHTWNPMVGCSVFSDGCKNCYAMRQAHRLEHAFKMKAYQGTTEKVNEKPVWTGKMNRATNATMLKPYTLPPGMVFVNSMSDFWHEAAKDEWRHEALEIMLANTQHIFQILTKRPQGIIDFAARAGLDKTKGNWFPPNVWIGATVENAKAMPRIDVLRRVPAAVCFLSCEPLIGPIRDLDLDGIDWVITGGESGPGARRCDPDWLRRIAAECDAWDVPHFFKQWGKPENNPLYYQAPPGIKPSDWVEMNDPVGKGGSMLDGVSYKQWPTARIAQET